MELDSNACYSAVRARDRRFDGRFYVGITSPNIYCRRICTARRGPEAELGVSAVELAQTQRLLLAKRLLRETALDLTDIAFASGFGSVRRFNALFKSRYGLEPRTLRAKSLAHTP